MKATTIAKRALGAFFAAAMLSAACAGSALAVTVHGADHYTSGTELELGKVDVLDVDGEAGEHVFLTVYNGNRVIAKNLPFTIGENAGEGDDATWSGIATLDISNFDISKLDGSYTVKVNETRAGGAILYEGGIYGVYADLDGETSKLIGTRTVNGDEATARGYQPAETLYIGGKTYKLASSEPTGTTALHYAYEAYDEATTIDGTIRYVDGTGEIVATTKVPGIKYEAAETVKVPEVVKADSGALYRTVHFRDSVKLENPGKTSATIYCALMTQADQAASGYYLATIKLVDEKGTAIATDSVNVTGPYHYTAPATIYKTVTVDAATGEQAVVQYKVKGSPVIALDPAADGVTTGARTVTVEYETIATDSSTVDVTYNLIDGRKRIGDKDRLIGKATVTATDDNPKAVPPATAKNGDEEFKIVGSPDDYAFTIHNGEIPVIDVYYIPEGYVPDSAYDVTVNYVNIATNAVVDSQTVSSSPDDLAAITIETPETFAAEGVNYVRVTGQNGTISHSYYSGKSTYTVYYRDENDELSAGSVINQMRSITTTNELPAVNTGTEVTDEGTEDEGTEDEGTTVTTTTVVTTGGGAAPAAATAAPAQDASLNDESTYNVFDGEDDNATLTNEEGVDSNTERIEDNENPLASGVDTPEAALDQNATPSWALPVAVVVALAVAALIVLFFMRRRRSAAPAIPIAEDASDNTDGDKE